MPLKPSKRLIFCSGNGNKPNTSIRLALFQCELHIHDMKSVFQVILGGIALIVWLKSMNKKGQTDV